MNSNDRQLIAELFERMSSVRGLDKDGDAEAFIHQSMRDNGDSPYLLVQSVLAQEVALQAAAKRIEALESQVSQSPSGQRASSGFGGDAATGAAAPWETSKKSSSGGSWGAPVFDKDRPKDVPPVIANARDGGAQSSTSSVPTAGRSRPSGAGGGSFMAQAMTTAAGVAGGMLLANSIGSLFGGGATTPASAATSTDAPTSTDAAGDTKAGDSASDSAAHDQEADQSGLQDASHEEDYGGDDDWGMDDFGGGDFDI